MKDETLTRIGLLTRQVATAARRAKWHLLRTTPDAIRQTARERVEHMKAESEPFRRLPRSEHARIEADIEKELGAQRRLSAGVARWHVQPRIAELAQLHSDYIERCRRDTAASFPDDVLYGFNSRAMVTLSILRELRRNTLEHAPVSELLEAAQRAMQAKDATGLVDLELIEARVRRGKLAEKPADLPIAKQLNDYIEELQELRVPVTELSDVQSTIEYGRTQISMADLIQLTPINADHPANIAARQAFEAETEAYQAAEQAAREAAVEA